MRGMFREIDEVRETADWEAKLDRASELCSEASSFIPGANNEFIPQALQELGFTSIKECSGLEMAAVLKRARDIRKSQEKKGSHLFGIGKKSNEEIKEILEARKPEMPKLREVEKDLSNEGMLKAETKPQQQAQASYNEKYQAAMQAAQELAKSGFYTLEDAIRIVMANL